jgi:hypothetical protein
VFKLVAIMGPVFLVVTLSMRFSALLIRLIVCCVVVLFPAPHAAAQDDMEFVPPNDGYDWLRLVSGEWLRGELIGAFGDKVEFDSDVLDELVLDAEDVEGFYSERVFGVSVRGGEIIIGRIRFEGDTISVKTIEDTLEFSRDELVAVTASAKRERDRWSGDISLGFNVRHGTARKIRRHWPMDQFRRRTTTG